ncbi:MAG: OmpH family outer membrane protein [Bacteroidetes bacterium]|nr:OmpH family outer membrane protein [Bacteroidota bacterium]
MKKLLFTAIVFLFMGFAVHAQKFAYVDSQYILDNLPEFTEAQAQLDELSNQWQKEVEAKFAEVDKMYKDYQTQAVLLPEDMKKKKEQEIVDKEKEAKNLQKKRFGVDGDLFKKRQELVKPIQEKVYNAIQELATSNSYMIIFDKSGSLTILFANPKYDISDEVLDNLGATMGGRKGKSQAGDKNQGNQPKSNTSEQPKNFNDQKNNPPEQKNINPEFRTPKK